MTARGGTPNAAEIERSEDESGTAAEDHVPPVTVDPTDDTPFVVIPRGGAREVGRSCYQVETQHGTYLVDAGLNQGGNGLFPDLRGLEEESIDAVFLTHAHIDHIGALPVLESRNLLAQQAPIITTRPTEALADTLLKDSLKIHQERAQQPGREQQYSEVDVRKVLSRFEPRGYIDGDVQDFAPHLPTQETLSFSFGNAGHLLGSAWLSLETAGSRVVFSGDIGGRSNHLPDIEEPPIADTLFLESTYGDTHSHTSASDTRTALFEDAIEAATNGWPVLIPSFGVGRSQELLFMFANRLHTLDDETRSQLRLIYDGMAVNATATYNEHAVGEFVAKSIQNLRVSNGEKQPFLPKQAFAGYDIDRKNVFEWDQTPIIIAPSGMLAGGWAPSYLVDFVERYDEARLFLTGFQAEDTPGRVIESGLQEGLESIPVTLPANGIDEGLPDDEGTPVEIPAHWVKRYHGLSAHAARNELLQFARKVSPSHISLVHGEAPQQKKLAAHLDEHVSSVDYVTRAELMTAIPVRQGEVDEDEFSIADRPAKTLLDEADHDFDEDLNTRGVGGDYSKLVERLRTLELALRTLDAQVAMARHDDGLSEATIREIVRDELDAALGDLIENTS